MAISAFEIDFLPVGDETMSGDAILFRYEEDDSGDYKIVLIDGGFKATAITIDEHIQKYYRQNGEKVTKIDHIICSHPDRDHIGGISDTIDKYEVGTLWINDPANVTDIKKLPLDSCTDSFSQADAETVAEIIELAESHNVTVKSPYSGKQVGPFVVCSPSKGFYKKLVEGTLERRDAGNLSFKDHAKKFFNSVKSIWTKDMLYEYPSTSACNESSTVLFAKIDSQDSKIILTADAGIEALTRAANHLETNYSFVNGSLSFMQVPHHGSRHNVNTKTLDALLGKKIPEKSEKRRGTAIASVAKKATDYPRKSVSNAFITRGYTCLATHGQCTRHSRGMPARVGWSRAEPIDYSQTEEELD